MTHADRLARLIIYMAAVIVWALSGRDEKLFQKVKEQGQMKWQTIKGG